MRTKAPVLVAIPAALLLSIGLSACDEENPIAVTTASSSSLDDPTGAPTTSAPTHTSTSGPTTKPKSSESATPSTSPSSSAKTLPISLLSVGDCISEIASKDGQTNPGKGTVSRATVVDCNTPHQYEVYGQGDISGDVYPDDSTLEDQVRNICEPAFQSYVGIDMGSSSYKTPYISPTDSSWASGDRTVTCMLEMEDGSQSSQSAKGAVV